MELAVAITQDCVRREVNIWKKLNKTEKGFFNAGTLENGGSRPRMATYVHESTACYDNCCSKSKRFPRAATNVS